jgi:sulfotransferase family protein
MTTSSERLSAERVPQRRVPDFFIVGHHKSGTTALYEMLKRHPQIYMPDLKEPRFFGSDLRALVKHAPSSGRPETFDEYLALFENATPAQRVGEASPSYLRSYTAAGEIAEVQPEARIIAILREPASFVRSLHFQLVQERVERETDLRKAFAREEIVRGGQRVLRYSDHVHYADQLRRYHEAFSRERVLVLIYDDFRRDNEATVRRVLRFLDVDDAAPIAVTDANPTVSVRSVRLDGMVRSLQAGRGPLSRAAKATVEAVVPRRLGRNAFWALRRRLVYGAPQPPDEAFMLELRSRFKGEVAAVSDYLGRDLVALWGYDDVA